MSDPLVHVRLREVELDFIVNGVPDPHPNDTIERTLADLHRWAETVADLIDKGVVE